MSNSETQRGCETSHDGSTALLEQLKMQAARFKEKKPEIPGEIVDTVMGGVSRNILAVVRTANGTGLSWKETQALKKMVEKFDHAVLQAHKDLKRNNGNVSTGEGEREQQLRNAARNEIFEEERKKREQL